MLFHCEQSVVWVDNGYFPEILSIHQSASCYLHFLLWKLQLMRIFYFVKLQILNSVRVPVSTMLVKYCSIQYWFYVFSATFCRVFVKITDIENNTQPIDIQGTHEDTITGKNTDFHKFGFLFLWFIFLSTILSWTEKKKYNQRQSLVDFKFYIEKCINRFCIKAGLVLHKY